MPSQARRRQGGTAAIGTFCWGFWGLSGFLFSSCLSSGLLQQTVGAWGWLSCFGARYPRLRVWGTPLPAAAPTGPSALQAVGPFFLAHDRLQNNQTRGRRINRPLMKAAWRCPNRNILWKHKAVKLRWGALNVRTLNTQVENVGGKLVVTGANPCRPYDLCRNTMERGRDHGHWLK